MEKDPKIQQSSRFIYFPVMTPHIEEANYGDYYRLSHSRLRAVGAFVWHISYELGSADENNQRIHTNIFALKERVHTMTDDGTEKRLDKIKRMMNMIMMNIAPIVAHIGKHQHFSRYYPDIVQEFYLWNLCSPFCMFVTDLRKRLSWYEKLDYYTKQKKIYYEIRNAIYNHMTNTYIKLKSRNNFYCIEPLLWSRLLRDEHSKNPINIAINKIEREEFARSLIKVPADCRISSVDFVNTTLSLLLNDIDIEENFNRDYCRFILNKKVMEYRGNIEELCNQDPADENKIIDFVFDEAEKVLNEHTGTAKQNRQKARSINNR